MRSSHNTYFEPNTIKHQTISDLLIDVSSYVVDKANQYMALFKQGTKIETHPNKSFYSDLPFCGVLNQIIAAHASAAARSITNKVKKALKLEPEERSKYQEELLVTWESGISIDKINVNLSLDERVVSISDGDGTSHDYWVNFKFPRMKLVSLPLRKTRHMRQLAQRGYGLKRNAIRINQDGSVVLIYNKSACKKTGESWLGVDLGRDKIITTSEGHLGESLTLLLNKINRKKRGSRAYDRAKIEIKNTLNRSAKNDIDYLSFDKLVIEKLTDMKRDKSWGNRSHHWRVGLLRQRIISWAEEFGVQVLQVNPAYTSQTCSDCGHCDKNNRFKERFRCLRCGFELDADVNAAKTILQKGVYVSLLRQQRNLEKQASPVLTG